MNSTSSTTTSIVPFLFRDFLSGYASIDYSASTSLPAANAVEKLESEVGWDSLQSSFVKGATLAPLQHGLRFGAHSNSTSFAFYQQRKRPLYDLFDIVIPTIRDLDFLHQWEPFIRKFHIIVIQDGDPKRFLKLPSWADFELYNRIDIERALGNDAWIISKGDASIRNFGFLVSDKDFIFTLDDDCLPAHDNTNNLVDAIKQHAHNLMTPSTPYFFNTVYDPYRRGVDFVRGYPYSLRDGVPTAVSHGLWMNAYDYDAPTQLLKVEERNLNYYDMTLTIPHKVFYPMCSMNLAFNRKLIGPAFMQGLMGEGQPWARYDDMFCGWASKLVGDHIGVGTKSGAPYIFHKKASNPFTNLKKEFMGLFWQEEIIQFFKNVTLSSDHKDASSAYLELANLIQIQLSHLNPYFIRLGEAMKTWVLLWSNRHGAYDADTQNVPADGKTLPLITPVASRSSMGPKNANTTCAIFTIAHNEAQMLPIFLKYYETYANRADIYILDHETRDGSTKNLSGFNVIQLFGDDAWMPHTFLNRKVELMQQRLLRSGYRCVLFAEVDEIVIANPHMYRGGLREYFERFIVDKNKTSMRTKGYHIGHISEGQRNVEASLDWSKSILSQRKYGFSDTLYNKPLLSKIPLRYIPGHHNAFRRDGLEIEIDENLILYHLHYVDKTFCVEREKMKYEGAKTHGKKNEHMWGVNNYIGKPFDPETQCSFALAKTDSNGQIFSMKDGKKMIMEALNIMEDLF